MPDTKLDYRRLGQFVRELREMRGWTLAELGNRAGLAEPTVGEIERGDRCPRMETLGAIAGAFDALPSDLLKEAGL